MNPFKDKPMMMVDPTGKGISTLEECTRLNAFDNYKDMVCINCKRKFPETVLHIEGMIHHNEHARCFDLKECRRAQRKLKRKVL